MVSSGGGYGEAGAGKQVGFGYGIMGRCGDGGGGGGRVGHNRGVLLGAKKGELTRQAIDLETLVKELLKKKKKKKKADREEERLTHHSFLFFL